MMRASTRKRPPSARRRRPSHTRSIATARPMDTSSTVDSGTPSRPLATCLMPTRNRRRFVPHAIACFLKQDYPHLELLVADDGEDAIVDLLPADPRVRYLRMDQLARIGTKRNMACAAARGDVIVHWDDDDWSAPWRVSYQVASLIETGADICGLARILFYEPLAARAWEYVYPPGDRPWVHGATLAYRASFWQASP